MKNTIIWLCGILIGGLAGYGVGILQSTNPYFYIGLGIILGSTIAITFNVHREEEDIPDELMDEEFVQEEETPERQKPNRQKAS